MTKLKKMQGKIGDFTTQDLKILEKLKNAYGVSTFDRRTAKRAISNFANLVDESLKYDDLTTAEKKFLETQLGNTGQSIDDIRHALTREKKLKDKIGDLIEYYDDNPGDARMVEVLEEVDLIDWDDVDYYDLKNFVETNPEYALEMGVLTAAIPHLTQKEAEDLLRDATNLPNSAIRDIVNEYNKSKPGKDDSTDTPPTEKEETTPIQTQPDPDPDPTKPDPPKQKTPPTQESEPTPDEDPTITPPIKLSLEAKQKRKEMSLQLFRGSKKLYEVSFNYKGGKTQEIGPVEARSLPDALGKAQRKRSPNKTLPRVIVVDLIGKVKK